QGSLAPLKAYIGRPWKEYSKTIIMQSNIDAFIDPSGWSPWNTTNFGKHTCFMQSIRTENQVLHLTKKSQHGEVTKREFQETLLTNSLTAISSTQETLGYPRVIFPLSLAL
uniref:Pectinesterase catalytic domain-containing protein n=1 Tax=Solanum lycopersicum TaxID=4081 RepID=A0A3Q7EFY0_SOLLC